MVILRAAKAEGSFMGMGTHVWLVIEPSGGGEKVSFSGAKAWKNLSVYKNYKRDHDKLASRGEIIIPPPEGMSEEEWERKVCLAGEEIMAEYHNRYLFSGIWPYGKKRGNCCTILSLIIHRAGGVIPRGKIKGFVPGLVRCGSPK